MQNFLHTIYCLRYSQAVLISFLLLWLFAALQVKFGSRRWWRPACISGALLMAIVIVTATLLSREPGTVQTVRLQPFYALRTYLAGVNSEGLRTSFMNALLFLPLGVLGVAAQKGKRPLWKRALPIVLLCCLLSACVESAQYLLACGETELDDVICNTLGALLGCVLGPALYHLVSCADRRNG